MINWLKKHFIPHEGNNHRPHILRDYSTRSIVIIVLFLELFTFLIPTFTHINQTGNMAAVLPGVLSALTNDERQSQNLQTLTISSVLNKAAEMKAKDMATYGYFAHTSPAGKTPWYWLARVGYQYQYAGENLAINFSDSKDVTDAWMNSPTHKANIVKGNYTEIGTGVANGMYEGKEAIFVAQVYANPLPAIEQNKKIETKPEIQKTVSINKTSSNILGAETSTMPATANTIQTKPITDPAFWQKLFASPRNTTNIILYIVFGIIAIALLLYIFIKMRNHHKDLITNGLIVLAIVGAIFVTNYYLSHRDMVVTTSLDYSNLNK